MEDNIERMHRGVIQSNDLQSDCDRIEQVLRESVDVSDVPVYRILSEESGFHLPKSDPRTIENYWDIDNNIRFFNAVDSFHNALECLERSKRGGGSVIAKFADGSGVNLSKSGKETLGLFKEYRIKELDICGINFYHGMNDESVAEIASKFSIASQVLGIEQYLRPNGMSFESDLSLELGDITVPKKHIGDPNIARGFKLKAGLSSYTLVESMYRELIEKLEIVSGGIKELYFIIYVHATYLREVEEICIPVFDAWSASFYGEYSSSPFERPRNLSGEAYFPVCSALESRDKKLQHAYVCVRHSPERPSDIVLFSEREPEFLESVIANL